MAKPDQFADRIKENVEVKIVEVTLSNREVLAKKIVEMLSG
jgi:nucleoside-triphosphatase THEP1